MTTLNNHIRDTIINAAINAAYDKKFKDIAEEEHEVGMALYVASFKKKTLEDVAAVPKDWFRQDSCLRFNCGGHDVWFIVKKAVPVPYSRDCNRLENFDHNDPSTKLGQGFSEKKRALENERNDAKNQLKAIIYSCRTIKKLKDVWPQGLKFYSSYSVEPMKSGLPAIQVESVNKLLGLK